MHGWARRRDGRGGEGLTCVGAVRAHGSASSEQPHGKPLYPMPTIRFVGLTMHAPTCRFGSFERYDDSTATAMK